LKNDWFTINENDDDNTTATTTTTTTTAVMGRHLQLRLRLLGQSAIERPIIGTIMPTTSAIITKIMATQV